MLVYVEDALFGNFHDQLLGIRASRLSNSLHMTMLLSDEKWVSRALKVKGMSICMCRPNLQEARAVNDEKQSLGCGDNPPRGRCKRAVSVHESQMFNGRDATPRPLTPFTYDLFIPAVSNRGLSITPLHMNTAPLIFASAFAIAIPIISVQLPRYFERCETLEDNGYTHPMTDGSNTPPQPSNWKFPRKPWDPPFPSSSKAAGKRPKSEYLILPPLSPKQNQRLGNGTSEEKPRCHEEVQEDEKAVEPRVQESREEAKKSWPIMSILWTSLVIFAGILLVFCFALLIAHCLAWLVVYKTEARLGEARRGLVQGGEMRLCLCARG